MAERREGDERGALDPRDLKWCRNQCDVYWAPQHDPFQWRSRLPLARWALAELQLIGWPLALATAGLAFLAFPWKLIAVAPAVLLALVVYFFRDPRRQIPQGHGLIVAPADGRIVELSHVALDPFVGGPALRIGIFLSIFNVHINRAPLRSRVIRLEYRPGAFLNALDPQSAVKNEAMWIGLEDVSPPRRRLVVRQISGMIARRIVCVLRPGEVLERGEKFGMIKLGSRTELILPADGFTPQVTLGDKVRAGSDVLGRWE
jgi:phosphatidylserine decarboxylase